MSQTAPVSPGLRRFLRRRVRTHEMPLMDHLRELRKRLVISSLAFLAISTTAFFFYQPILGLIQGPLCSLDPKLLGPQGCDLIFVRVMGGFMFRLKVTALAGIFVSAPIWLYQIWAFVTPALRTSEKRYALPFVASTVVLFATGAVFAYLTLPTGLRLLISIGGEGLVPLLGAEEYLSFVGLLLLGFGVMFELPLLLFFLGLAGVISVQQLRQHRKAALVSIVALAAIVTPSQDPYTLLVLSVPLYLLYEGTILILTLIARRKKAPAKG